jgi:DNA-binding NarL/FixJ family response regulator
VRSFKILVVEDYERFRGFVCSLLQQRSDFQITEASDGLEAVQKAEALQPDLILLDIGLPKLNGIEVARHHAVTTRILFLSQESSADVIREALSLGAGYVHKPCAQSDLLPAIEAVLEGKRFVSTSLELGEDAHPQAAHDHELLFCSSDAALLDGLTRFIAGALNFGNAAIVWATQSHRDSLLERLRTHGVDIDAALRQGTYIASDIAEPPDPARILRVIRSLSEAASKAGKKHPCVAVCGERAGRLWAEGKTDVAMGIEQLFNEVAKSNSPDLKMDILCVYPVPYGQEEHPEFKNLCAEHTAVSSR